MMTAIVLLVTQVGILVSSVERALFVTKYVSTQFDTPQEV